MTTALFITLAVITVLSAIALFVFICLYVYNDALVNSDKPVLWLLITIFTPNLFGFLIYMLVGRSKDRKPVRKFKLPAVISGIIVLIATTAFTASVFISSDIPVINNVSVGMVTNNIGSKWEVSYKSSGETLERTIAVTDEELNNLTVEASCEEGEMYLLLIQGKNAEVIDITDFPESKLTLPDFTAGNIKLSLYNESAKNAKIKIDW
ncbi:MAG: PLDc N-terminal domain-containing protein [Ruminiclostridium sp.]|nr:PLDc N-terminal domain-containing protein [Ruminiclostridium sp.]